MFEMSGYLTMDLLIRFLINIMSLFVLLRLIHYRHAMRRGTIGGFLLFGNGIFIVTALLHNIEMSMGFAFGLFAVFAMLRYRTEELSTTDMAYLFVSIAISLMSAVSRLNFAELALINGLMCLLAVFCESRFLAPKILEKTIVYEKVDLVHPNRMDDLIEDLQQRTGLKIERIEVGDVNYLRDTAVLKIYYQGDRRLI